MGDLVEFKAKIIGNNFLKIWLSDSKTTMEANISDKLSKSYINAYTKE